MAMPEGVKKKLLGYQRNEITEYHIYSKLAKTLNSPENRRVLERIAADELQHYRDWRRYTRQDVKPDRLKVWKYYFISRIFGFTFGIKLMERGEEKAQANYEALRNLIPEVDAMVRSENEHEDALIRLLDEERLRYVGSVVLGLNDALVELTGALAGFTLALRNTKLIALTGLITGIAAAFSMAASEYLSTKAEEAAKSAGRASLYTGVAYIVTVVVLVLPYLVFRHYYVCLGCTLIIGLLIIAFFNYYLSVAKDLSFKERFLEMAGLSLGVAALSFLVGFVLRSLVGVDV